MGSGKGGGTGAKSNGGKGGGEVEAMPQGSGGMLSGGGGNNQPVAGAGGDAGIPVIPEPYNAQRDFYGDGNHVNQPLPGYFESLPAPGGNNYAPPVQEVVEEVEETNPIASVPSTGPANTSPEVRQAFSAGANNQASANELAAFNLGVPDTNEDGRLSNDEFTSWDGYGAYSEKNGPGILLSGGPGGEDGSRFTGQYGPDGKPIYTSGFRAAQANMYMPGQGQGQGQQTYNPGFLPNSGTATGNRYNPEFLPNKQVFDGTILNPNIYKFM